MNVTNFKILHGFISSGTRYCILEYPTYTRQLIQVSLDLSIWSPLKSPLPLISKVTKLFSLHIQCYNLQWSSWLIPLHVLCFLLFLLLILILLLTFQTAPHKGGIWDIHCHQPIDGLLSKPVCLIQQHYTLKIVMTDCEHLVSCIFTDPCKAGHELQYRQITSMQ